LGSQNPIPATDVSDEPADVNAYARPAAPSQTAPTTWGEQNGRLAHHRIDVFVYAPKCQPRESTVPADACPSEVEETSSGPPVRRRMPEFRVEQKTACLSGG
jgi:hypothetical protein